MIEVEVHHYLRTLLRQHPTPVSWPHQLTMARLVARGLRLQRSVLMQVSSTGQHRLSYLLPSLMWPGATILCVPSNIRTQLLHEDIPWLQQRLALHKPVYQDTWPGGDGLILMTPQAWLQQRRNRQLPAGIPMIMDGTEQLPEWVDQVFTISLPATDWLALQQALPSQRDLLSTIHQTLTTRLLRRPLLRFPLYPDEAAPLLAVLATHQSYLPQAWLDFWLASQGPDYLLWVEKEPEHATVALKATLLAPAQVLAVQIWPEQPMVMIGQGIDHDPQAQSFRQRLGIPPLTTLSFGSHRERDLPVLIPPAMPAPNTPQFRSALLHSLHHLLGQTTGYVVIVLSDQPLLQQVGATLAAEWGSRVRVNSPPPPHRGILVCSWDYWLQNSLHLPAPDLVVVGTLPFPSMEDPLVAGRVDHYKHQHQDWFRQYLLPVAATRLQQGVTMLRRYGGTLAILDSRILTRSYGEQFLAVLQPLIRTAELLVEAE